MTHEHGRPGIQFLAAAVLATVALTAGCSSEPAVPPEAQQTAAAHSLMTGDLITAPLTEAEAKGVIYMREEEKLARDVYEKLGELWGINTFKNIGDSEQRHMDEVLLLIEKYGLPDPVEGNDIGIFEDAVLRQLHDDLVALGGASEVEALQVGAAIEEIDILDLQSYLEQTDNPDLEQVYGDLLTGSMKHLSSFTSVLAKRGVTYEPQYLDGGQYDQILSSEFERGGRREPPAEEQ